jgi:hypothetical protein
MLGRARGANPFLTLPKGRRSPVHMNLLPHVRVPTHLPSQTRPPTSGPVWPVLWLHLLVPWRQLLVAGLRWPALLRLRLAFWLSVCTPLLRLPALCLRPRLGFRPRRLPSKPTLVPPLGSCHEFRARIQVRQHNRELGPALLLLLFHETYSVDRPWLPSADPCWYPLSFARSTPRRTSSRIVRSSSLCLCQSCITNSAWTVSCHRFARIAARKRRRIASQRAILHARRQPDVWFSRRA